MNDSANRSGGRTDKSILLDGESSWKVYAKMVSKGSSPLATSARLVLLTTGNTPSQSRRCIEARVESGKIDAGQFILYSDAIDALEDAWRAGIQTHATDTTNREQWRQLGNGCHMKVDHLGNH